MNVAGPCHHRVVHARRSDSVAAEAAFRKRLAELGATLLEPEWLGRDKPHRVRCGQGHDCRPRPASVLRGQGPCWTCSGRSPVAAEANFRKRLAELGAELLEPYVNNKSPLRIRCRAGHVSRKSPQGVMKGPGICRVCSGKDPADAEAKFRAGLHELGAVPLFEKWLGSEVPHPVRCAAGHDWNAWPARLRQGSACGSCAGNDTAAAEAKFRALLDELGATLLEPEWLGSHKPHRVRCAQGHDCRATPHGAVRRGSFCKTCAGLDPAIAEAKFRARLGECGATLLEPYVNSDRPHLVRCAKGHLSRPRPHDVIAGHGPCRFCKCKKWDVFYVVTGVSIVKFGITSGDPRPRLRVHAAQGYTEVVRLVTGLSATTAQDVENAVRSALAMAGERPVSGREHFDASCLALILDVADSWLVPRAGTASACAWPQPRPPLGGGSLG